MAKIEIKKGESIDKALRRFKSKIRNDGIIDEVRKREFYEKPAEKRRKRLARAIRKEKRRQREQ